MESVQSKRRSKQRNSYLRWRGPQKQTQREYKMVKLSPYNFPLWTMEMQQWWGKEQSCACLLSSDASFKYLWSWISLAVKKILVFHQCVLLKLFPVCTRMSLGTKQQQETSKGHVGFCVGCLDLWRFRCFTEYESFLVWKGEPVISSQHGTPLTKGNTEAGQLSILHAGPVLKGTCGCVWFLQSIHWCSMW